MWETTWLVISGISMGRGRARRSVWQQWSEREKERVQGSREEPQMVESIEEPGRLVSSRVTSGYCFKTSLSFEFLGADS